MTTEISKGDARRIGIFGGTFNPIHQGHLKAAREVATALDLERVVFVPSANPPHKTDLAHDPIAPATDRMRWVEACVDGIADFEVNGLELERAGASYSIDTLTSVTKALAPARLFFILGYDAFIEMGTWRAPGEILKLVDVVVMSRPRPTPGIWVNGSPSSPAALSTSPRTGSPRRTSRAIPTYSFLTSTRSRSRRLRSGSIWRMETQSLHKSPNKPSTKSFQVATMGTRKIRRQQRTTQSRLKNTKKQLKSKRKETPWKPRNPPPSSP
jgi:nicotinate (nicotinamide) nucleotide adenylyltransferase